MVPQQHFLWSPVCPLCNLSVVFTSISAYVLLNDEAVVRHRDAVRKWQARACLGRAVASAMQSNFQR
jgi:hypothetical protein